MRLLHRLPLLLGTAIHHHGDGLILDINGAAQAAILRLRLRIEGPVWDVYSGEPLVLAGILSEAVRREPEGAEPACHEG